MSVYQQTVVNSTKHEIIHGFSCLFCARLLKVSRKKKRQCILDSSTVQKTEFPGATPFMYTELIKSLALLYNSKIHLNNSLSVWLYSPLDLGRFFSFLILYTVGRTAWTGDQLVARPLPKHRTTQTQNKHIHVPNIHALCGIRTYDPGFRSSEDGSCLRPRGHFDRHHLSN
jgi:hypothetical protein